MISPAIVRVADYAGFALNDVIKGAPDKHGFVMLDLRPGTADPVDHPGMHVKADLILTCDDAAPPDRR